MSAHHDDLPFVGPVARSVLITGVATAGLVAYLNLRPEQDWILWVTAGLIAIAVEGTVRANPHWHGGGTLDAVVYVLLPAIGTLGAGYFIDDAVDGYPRFLSGIGAGIAIGIAAFGEYHTVSFGSRLYGAMRLILAVGTYLAAFALFTVFFSRDLDVPVAATAVGIVSLALGMELLRESRLTGPSSILAGLAIGVSLAELRIALYFFPLDGLLAGALLIIGFYLATGLVHHLLDEDLELGTLAEYLLVAGAGTAAVVIARVYV